ncbi:MAG: hypothetical protein HKL90_08585 [Elusimicrobia bacterium]|nr:hypothetical protein [Elusimicrobiota bacterium]
MNRRAAWAALALAAGWAWLAAGALSGREAFLPSRPPARWMRVSDEAVLTIHRDVPGYARYRTRFEAPRGGVKAELDVRARGETEIVLDRRLVAPPAEAPGGSTSVRRATLNAGPGAHVLLVIVRAALGPPTLWAQAPALGVYSGARWEASADDGRVWAPACDAEQPLRADEFSALPGADEGFRATALWTVPFLFLGVWLSRRTRDAAGAREAGRAASAVAAVAWLTLAAAAFAFLRPGLGYDAYWHADYTERLVRTWRLPAPGDAWQTFQAPLYYALCVPLWLLAHAQGREPEPLMRLPSLLSGFALGWACRRFVSAARPGRPDLALAAGLFGWFWPANLFIAQTPSNEPLAGALAALLLAECARVGPAPLKAGRSAWLGALCGAAFLTKATAVLVLPPAFLLLLPVARRSRRPAALVAAFAAAAFVVGGWFYARTWALYGAPFIGGWDPTRGIRWWQDPGYRTAGDFLRFGAALYRPFYAGLKGFWDALYSTFWCDGWQAGVPSLVWLPPRPFDWQAADAWWGLIPTALIALGARRAFTRRDAASGAALAGIFCGVLALARLFLAAPIYSTVKASYLLGLGPLFALLLADGLDALAGLPRAAAWAATAAWAAAAFRGALPL